MPEKYQKNYASDRPQMYDEKSRIQKATRIVKTLRAFFKNKKMTKMKILDVGASTGIIDNYLADFFGYVTGVDIDKEAINFAKKKFRKKNLVFKVDNAMALSFSNNFFDVVICTHVYEHVPNSRKLFSEIHRVLKPGGICYLAAVNRLWPIEPHYSLPFLSYLPKKTADFYIKLVGKNEYYERPLDYWQLKKLLRKFKIHNYTPKIFINPKKFGYSESIPSFLSPVTFLLSPILKYLAPTMFWLLEK